VKLGCAGANELDRIDLAIEMSNEDVEYLGMDCLAERTLAFAQLRRLADPTGGYNPVLEARMRGVLPGLARNGIKLTSNMGAANPVAAGRVAGEIARELGITGLKIGVITGDDLLERIGDLHLTMLETGGGLDTLPGEVVSVNAYLGAEHIANALGQGADVVVGGRLGDLALYLGCMIHHFGWDIEDYQTLGAGSVVAHLLECGRYVTGGAYAEPGWDKPVERADDLGFPLAEVERDGAATLTKQANRGGMISIGTCKEQLLYEVHDPGRYITPDVVVDIRDVRLEDAGPNRVRVTGGRGTERTETLKVLVGVAEGFIAEGEISFAGRGALAKAEESRQIVEARLRRQGVLGQLEALRVDVIGVHSILGPGLAAVQGEPQDVRLRLAARCGTRELAETAAFEFQDLWFGPAGGAGARSSVRQIISLFSSLVPRSEVPVDVDLFAT
jgi:hypothetical protein